MAKEFSKEEMGTRGKEQTASALSDDELTPVTGGASARYPRRDISTKKFRITYTCVACGFHTTRTFAFSGDKVDHDFITRDESVNGSHKLNNCTNPLTYTVAEI